MDIQEVAEKSKRKNIIEMAVWFTAMMPLFQGSSGDLVKQELESLFDGLNGVVSDEDFSKMHIDFCMWFIKTVKMAKAEGPPSYGHAAKVLDVALKVYVYYCKMPNSTKANYLAQRLHGVIDTPIVRHLFRRLEDAYGKPYPPHHLWSIKMIDKENYELLQKLIRQEIRDCFEDRAWPVQYDDVMGLRFDR